MSSTDTGADPIDLDARWEVAPSVSVRAERFGALLYDFTTRSLSLLRSHALLETLERLPDASSVREAMSHVAPAERPSHERALASLAASGVIRPSRPSPEGAAAK